MDNIVELWSDGQQVCVGAPDAGGHASQAAGFGVGWRWAPKAAGVSQAAFAAWEIKR